MTLDVLIADDDAGTLEEACRLVAAAGHRVVAREPRLPAAVAHVRACRPDVAVVAVRRDDRGALDLIGELRASAACPVVLLLEDAAPELVEAALERGVDAYACRATPDDLRSAIALARRRFGERQGGGHAPPGAAPPAVVEQAKGILMERHGLNAHDAYERLRRGAREQRITVAELADSLVRSHDLLPSRREGEGGETGSANAGGPGR